MESLNPLLLPCLRVARSARSGLYGGTRCFAGAVRATKTLHLVCGQRHASCSCCSPLLMCPCFCTRVQVWAGSVTLLTSKTPCCVSKPVASSGNYLPGPYRSGRRQSLLTCRRLCGFTVFRHGLQLYIHHTLRRNSPPSRFPTAGNGSVGNAMGPLPIYLY